MGMVAVGGRPQVYEVSEWTGRARPCANVKLWALNFSFDKEFELYDRRAEGKASPSIQRFGLNL